VSGVEEVDSPDDAGRYVLLDRIGLGGMAEVFRATARGAAGFERPVAIKRILPSLSEDADFIRMFIDEAKIAVQLQHPNIVQIFDLGRDGRDYFIAMEYVHGKDLRVIAERVHRNGERIPPSVAVHVAMKLCEALHHAHFATAAGGHPLHVVHRDVTPQNVMISYDGEVKVTDFGLARAAGRVTETKQGVIKGKLAYMAPEAFDGLGVDHRSDVYGVGILLWEMLTGMRLFLGHNDVETVQNAQTANAPRLRAIDPGIEPELDRIVARALVRDREDRYQTAEELHDELEAFAYEAQQFLTSSALGAWLDEVVPPPGLESEKRFAAEVVTREIRLGDPDVAIEEEPAEPLDTLADDGDDDEDTYERDTVPPPAASEPFDDTTARGTPRDPDVITVRHQERADPTMTKVPRAPALPASMLPVGPPGISWDDDEDTTAVNDDSTTTPRRGS
jgi:serine/threonine protein kinase